MPIVPNAPILAAKLTREREIAPYVLVHPDDDR
jgi:hypothetical protein